MAGTRTAMPGRSTPRAVGTDHRVLRVGDFAHSKDYYAKVLGFLGFKLKHDLSGFAGWSNGKTLFWIAQADSQGRKRAHRKGDIGFHHYAFELDSRAAVDALGVFLEKNGLGVADPPDSYNGDEKYYAVFFHDPDGLRLEAMHYGPAETGKKKAKKSKKTR